MSVTDDDAERALAWLIDNADKAAEAKATRIWADEYRKTLKALIANESNESSEAAKERFAYSHPKYREHLDELKKAVWEDEKMRNLRGAAELRIEVWRTMNANARAVKA